MNNPRTIPGLAQDLAETTAIKAEMTLLLKELEQTAAGHTIEKPGAWRHHPAEWAAAHQAPQKKLESFN